MTNPDGHIMTRATIFFSNVHKRWIIRADCKVGRLGDFFAPGEDEPTDDELKELFGQDIEISRMQESDPSKVVTDFDKPAGSKDW